MEVLSNPIVILVVVIGFAAFIFWLFKRRRAGAGLEIEVAGDGKYALAVVGESHYQDSLLQIIGEASKKRTAARLVPEKNNPYDKNAVAVMIDGLQVGHLDRHAAQSWRASLKRHRAAGAIATCKAEGGMIPHPVALASVAQATS